MQAIDELVAIMARLRDPGSGCPWDMKQTFETVLPYTLEEAYEVADAIQQGDMAELREELGDLLFQVVFHSQMAAEAGHFDLEGVAEAINDKMLRRHPHVFADACYADDEQLHLAWEHAKSMERSAGQAASGSALEGVARALPALVRAQKLQKRAARVGFDWPNARGAFDKVREELHEVEQALSMAGRPHLEEELGDLLFALVNTVRKLDLDAEHALRYANDKFERRFRRLEELLAAQGEAELARLDAETLDAAWEAVKREEMA